MLHLFTLILVDIEEQEEFHSIFQTNHIPIEIKINTELNHCLAFLTSGLNKKQSLARATITICLQPLQRRHRLIWYQLSNTSATQPNKFQSNHRKLRARKSDSRLIRDRKRQSTDSPRAMVKRQPLRLIVVGWEYILRKRWYQTCDRIE